MGGKDLHPSYLEGIKSGVTFREYVSKYGESDPKTQFWKHFGVRHEEVGKGTDKEETILWVRGFEIAQK